MWLLLDQPTLDFGPVASSTRFTSFLEKRVIIIVVSYSQCLLRGDVSTLYTIKKKIREQTLIDVEAAAGTYQYTKAVHQVPSDPRSKGTASKNKTLMYARDHFTDFAMDCLLRISVLTITSSTEQGIQLRKYQTYLL